MLVSFSNLSSSHWNLANTGQWDCIEQALDLKILDPDANDPDSGKTFAWLATSNKKYTLLDKMIQLYPRLNINACPLKDPGRTIVWMLANDNRWETIGAIVNNPYMNPDVNAYPLSLSYKATVVIMAAVKNQVKLVEHFLSRYQIDTDANIYHDTFNNSLFDTLCIHTAHKDEILPLYTLHQKKVPSGYPDCAEICLYESAIDFLAKCEKRIFVQLPNKSFLAHLPTDIQKLLFCFVAKVERPIYKKVSNDILTSWINPERIKAGLEQEGYRVAHPYTWWISTQVQLLYSKLFT